MELAVDQHGNRIQAVRFGPTAKASYSSSAGTTTAVGRRTSLVRIRATTNCFIASGEDPTATIADTPIVADVIEYVQVNPGDKLSAIRETDSGVIYVTEIK